MSKKMIHLWCECGRLPTEIIEQNSSDLQKEFICECQRKFLYWEGFIKFLHLICSENFFTRYPAISDYYEIGTTDVEVGIGKIIKLKEKVKKINYFSAGPGDAWIIIGEYKFPLVEKSVLKSENMLDSIWISPSAAPDVPKDKQPKLGSIVKVNYALYANRNISSSPAWSIIFKAAQEFMVNDHWRAAILEISSAFEVFVSDWCLRNRNFKPPVEGKWLFSCIEELMLAKNWINKKCNSKGWPYLYANMPDFLKNWYDKVKTKREDVFHNGASINEDETREAYRATLNAIKEIDLDSLFDLMPDTIY